MKFLRSTLPSTIAIMKEIHLDNELVLADSTQIYQILLNLCTNAAHAMEKATAGRLTVRAELTTFPDGSPVTAEIPGGDYVAVMVSDTGHGINPQTLHQIFDPYFTTKEVGKGTGMGLTIVQGLVKNHNGAITVASTPGLGTSFTVTCHRPQKKTGMSPRRFRPFPQGRRNSCSLTMKRPCYASTAWPLNASVIPC